MNLNPIESEMIKMCSHKKNYEHPVNSCSCDTNVPRIAGFVIPCLLILLKKQPSHGYELMEKLEKLSFLDAVPNPGVVYRHLRNLEEEGMVESKLEPGSGGPARKIYSLSPEGEDYLKSWVVNIRNRKSLLDKFLAACESLDHEPEGE